MLYPLGRSRYVDHFVPRRRDRREVLGLGQALDPDVVYTYVPLDDALLDRLDRDLMPSSVESHRRDNDWRPLFREAPEGLQALSLLPHLKSMPRWEYRVRSRC
jgi:hypothetical protein